MAGAMGGLGLKLNTSSALSRHADARSPFNTKIPGDWESSPRNDRAHYNACPAVKHSEKKGDFSPEAYHTRTFNRKMKMVDSFTRILPGYDHIANSCYTNSATHVMHPTF